MKELLLLMCLISTTFSFDSISLLSCNKSKACFKTSKSCNIDECQYIVTWKPVKHQGKSYIEFELVGEVYIDGGYIAIGFSTDKTMGDDGVMACYVNPGNPEVSIIAGYNEALNKKNIIFSDKDLDPDFIVKKNGNKYGGSFNSNIKRISCRFLRLISPELNNNKLMDLSKDKKYYLLVARGNSMGSEGLKKHTAGTTVVSDDMINFSSGSFNTVIGSSGLNSSLAKAHGVIMVIAWLCCCSIAIILGRYYKNTWISRNLEGAWFNSHRGLQGVGYVLIVIALILIFSHVGGYSKLEDFPYKLHPILGLITAILFLINPFIALCRCKPKQKRRPIFNWIHFIVGTVAYILSIPTIMIGLRLPAAGFVLSQLNYVQWIVFIFVIFQFCIELILEIHACKTHSKQEDKLKRYEREIDEYQKAIYKGHKNLIKPLDPRQTGRTFKLVILGIYISVTIIVTIALSIIIIVN